MIFRKRPEKPQLPDVNSIPRLTRAELEVILHGPNGAGKLRAQREYSLQASIGFQETIEQAEKHLTFMKAMKAASDGVVADIDAILREVAA